MSITTQREYYKIFDGPKQSHTGRGDIQLGYETGTTEILLPHNKETFFHIPFFSDAVALSASTLVAVGATAGHIPALSDRIMKFRGGYGNNTPHGNTLYEVDGVWLCAWLKYSSDGNHVWMDRFYDPGRISVQDALDGTESSLVYEKHDPVFTDVVSSLILEPETWFRYYHIGREGAEQATTVFSGVSSERLLLNLEDWEETGSDSSVYNNSVYIKNFQQSWKVAPMTSNYYDKSVLNFDTSDFVDASVKYSAQYTPANEYTLSVWCQSADWKTSPSTQLAGNYNSYAGLGIFVDSLSSYPWFAIPETNYGHLFYVNEKFNFYKDQSTQQDFNAQSVPSLVAVQRDGTVITVDSITKRLRGHNYNGDVIYTANHQGSPFLFIDQPRHLLCGAEQVVVITDSTTYRFDSNLTYQLSSSGGAPTTSSIHFNSAGSLVESLSSVAGCEFAGSQWHVSTTGEVYKDSVAVAITNVCDITVGPSGTEMFAAHTNGIVSVIDSDGEVLRSNSIGSLTTDSNRRGSFIRVYNRAANSFEWKYLLCCSLDQILFVVDVDTLLVSQPINLAAGGQSLMFSSLTQTSENFKFEFRGDFTGYEHKRMFNDSEYDGGPCITVRTTLAKADRNFAQWLVDRVNVQIPVSILSWKDREWHHIAAVVKNNTISLYLDGALAATQSYAGNLKLTTELQPIFCIGTPSGKTANLNTEIQTDTVIFNGAIDSVKIYNYALSVNEIRTLVRSKSPAESIYWDVQTPNLQFVETVSRHFKHKLPGAKSAFYVITISNSQITDLATRQIVEEKLMSVIRATQPAYADMLRFDWVD